LSPEDLIGETEVEETEEVVVLDDETVDETEITEETEE
jgi:hypothetical protein